MEETSASAASFPSRAWATARSATSRTAATVKRASAPESSTTLANSVEQELQGGLRRGNQLAEAFETDAEHGFVRILSAGRHQDARGDGCGGGDFGGALRGAQPGRIAVEHEHQLTRAGALDDVQVLLGERRSARRDGVLHASLVQPDGVEVALDEERHALTADGVARLVQGEENAAFRVQRRVGRVQVLRLALPFEEPTAERNGAARLADGNDDAAAEAIVEALLLLARNSEPGSLDELRVDLPARERLAQRVPQLGRVPEPPRFRGLDGDATPLQVIAGDGSTGMLPEDALIEDARLFIDLRERRPVRAA